MLLEVFPHVVLVFQGDLISNLKVHRQLSEAYIQVSGLGLFSPGRWHWGPVRTDRTGLEKRGGQCKYHTQARLFKSPDR